MSGRCSGEFVGQVFLHNPETGRFDISADSFITFVHRVSAGVSLVSLAGDQGVNQDTSAPFGCNGHNLRHRTPDKFLLEFLLFRLFRMS